MATPSSLIEERRQLLALLIDAYLQDSSEILVTRSQTGIRAIHPALNSEIPMNWTHMEALDREGKIYLTPLGTSPVNWKVNFPTRVLADLESGDSDLLGVSPGTDRVDRLKHGPTFNNYFSGTAMQNVAIDSPGTTFSGSIHVETGNLPSLLAALDRLGVPDPYLETLRSGIEVATHDERNTFAKGWLADLASGALGGTLANGVATHGSEGIAWLGAIVEAIKSFGISF